MKLPLFYRDPVVLSRAKHAELCLKPLSDYRFAANTNSLALTVDEFAKAAPHYPIVFAKTEERYSPVVLLGLNNGQNLFVGADGSWSSAYLPAYLRRYPFLLAINGSDEQRVVCLDQAYPGLNDQGDGAALFANGQETEYLRKSLDFVRSFDDAEKRTKFFCNRLAELDLLDCQAAQITLRDGSKHLLADFFVVSRDKLARLSAARLSELLKSGELELIFSHLLSLDNFNALVDRLADRKLNS